MTPAQMEALLARQKAAQAQSQPVLPAVRKDRLSRAIEILVNHQDAIVDALAADYGWRSPHESRIIDLMAPVLALRQARSALDEWMRPKRRELRFPLGLLGARARVEWQPLGSIGVMASWRAPVQTGLGPLAAIFAAGNRAIVHLPQATPETANLIESLVSRSFDGNELAIVAGDGESAAGFAALAFDHLVVTGTPEDGRLAMMSAAGNLVPVTLELAGKCPALLSSSTDPVAAARRIVAGKLLNAGQNSFAPDYVLVPHELEEAFSESALSAARTQWAAAEGNPDATAIISDAHIERLEALIDDAIRQGALASIAADDNDPRIARRGIKLPLVLLRRVNGSMRVLQEETGGPILPVIAYGTIDDALTYIAAGPAPPALYLFGNDPAEARHVLDCSRSGSVMINDVQALGAPTTLPWGGVGASGSGSWRGREGFERFSHARSLYRQSRFDIGRLTGMQAPYGPDLNALLEKEIRR